MSDTPNPNTNVLQGMRCPKCESFGPFCISYHTSGIFTDEGEDEQVGDHEWDDDSSCVCQDCDYAGIVGDFNEEDKPDEADATPHFLILRSEEYGEEVFEYDSEAEAQAGQARIEAQAKELNDGITRTFEITTVNPNADDEEEE